MLALILSFKNAIKNAYQQNTNTMYHENGEWHSIHVFLFSYDTNCLYFFL